ncbi:hypothetical protein KVR01_010717 [Diaporthe batatas]|uniref:uncharacterized protein n=1 Tax=Diaporthe batatas TaxID=748121 RepID=UPI001D045C4D|nr:uncharacterized protein KVR01_010717 [Diaporthe batatas]KAG8160080.1 hypothetical protein KVR01_010717 [Diaporthe batatas]
MQCFACFITLAIFGIIVNAGRNLSPIDGYNVVDFTWTVQPEIPGSLAFNLTGTVQDAWEHISNTWPDYPRPKMDLAFHLKPEHNMTDGNLICDFPEWTAAKMSAIQDGIESLRQFPGRPGLQPGPGSCARVSCADSSAIWWCSDHQQLFRLDNFGFIADGANDIILNCIVDRTESQDPEVQVWTKGQIFLDDNWNVIIRGDEDDC